ncbi:hypothetical protein H5410_047157 [Solanum commersonii]|uniref:F-box/LRR-repeat protein 15/At3g58940/PEG3-like LRR domain-containing protein n=1 Tax=Solanum commersonii TaxID=4109 RepID=A0A9J5XEC1_SOLCO|nr:hypothetical protein H5410_047157 [Solanum commersonii]
MTNPNNFSKEINQLIMMKATYDILSNQDEHSLQNMATSLVDSSQLEFRVDYLNGNMKKVDRIIERYQDRKIPIEKFELSDSSYSDEVFPLFDKWLHIALQNCVKDIIFGAKDIVFGVPRYTSYTLPIFTILAAKSLIELVLMGFCLKYVSLSSGGVANYNSLRKLSISSISLNDNMLQTLLNRFSLIVNLVLEYCYGLEKIELLNLQRIKSDTIKTFRNQRVKIDTPTLEHLYYLDAGEAYLMLDIINVPNLVSLEYIARETKDILKNRDQIPKTFVDDNLQWNCYPRKVILYTTNKMISCFMARFMNMRTSSHARKPLCDKLQEVTPYKFDWENQNWYLVELKSGKLALSRDKFYFLLDW